MPEPLVDSTAEVQPVTDAATVELQPAAASAEVVTASPLDDEKSKFAKFVAFVEHGIENLGSEAEAELVALAKHYL